MVVIPAGRFRMGCVSGTDCSDNEKPVHEVEITRPFALSKYEITFKDYDKFTYPLRMDLHDLGNHGWHPVFNVMWDCANEYAAWFVRTDGQALPPADGGGVGICSPGRQQDSLFLGK